MLVLQFYVSTVYKQAKSNISIKTKHLTKRKDFEYHERITGWNDTQESESTNQAYNHYYHIGEEQSQLNEIDEYG